MMHLAIALRSDANDVAKNAGEVALGFEATFCQRQAYKLFRGFNCLGLIYSP